MFSARECKYQSTHTYHRKTYESLNAQLDIFFDGNDGVVYDSRRGHETRVDDSNIGHAAVVLLDIIHTLVVAQ